MLLDHPEIACWLAVLAVGMACAAVREVRGWMERRRRAWLFGVRDRALAARIAREAEAVTVVKVG